MPLPKTLPTSTGENPSSQQSSRPERVLGNRYKVERRLGSGNFGVAQLVTDLKAGGEQKVLKELPMRDVEPGETVDAVREARLLSKLDHPNIVKFHDSFADEDCFCIVTEYCEGGDLDDKIKKWRQSHCEFDEQLILSWFVQLAMAIQYLHERRVLHRDLKARNIFLKNNMIKLGDFGISRILMGTSEYATTFAGTPYYMSPEVLKRENYNSKSDIWSLGVVLYELCCLQHAFHGKNFMDVLNGIVHGDTPQLPKKFHPNLQSLFQWMLNKDPQKRPSAVELLRDPYISGHLQDLLSKMTDKNKSATAESDAREILHALGPDRRLRKKRSPPAAKTPRQQLLERKQQKAEEEAERRKELAREKYAGNRQRYAASKLGQYQYVPPWVKDHPDVFNDSAFSITPLPNSSRGFPVSPLSPPTPPSEMPRYDTPQAHAVQMQPREQPVARDRRESWGLRCPRVAWEIPEDPQVAETYYTQVESFESDSEDEYDALIGCMENALDLSKTGDSLSITDEEDSESSGVPASAEQKRKKLKTDAERVLGVEQFRRVYDFLKIARRGDPAIGKAPVTDENIVQNQLVKLCDQPRNCFLVDQLIFMEDLQL